MARMTGGRALVKSIMAQGVDTVFGLPGVQMDHFFNALHDEGNAIRVIQTRHEQGAAYMAFGYAAAIGKVGTFAVVPGPGLLNTTAALSTAYGCNTPVLALTGQIPSAYIGRGLGMLHEIPDQLALIRGLTKWAERIEHPAHVPDRVAEAFKQMRTGRQRPVELEMALDIMATETEVGEPQPAAPTPPTPVDADLIEKAARLLSEAEQPLIFVGGGVFGAEAELLETAEMLQAPVISHRMGRGAIDDRHYLSQNQPVGHRLWATADVVLAVGTRLQHQRMSWGTDADLKIVHIDIDAAELKRISTPTVGIAADAKSALGALLPALAKYNRARPSREEELSALKAEMLALFEDKLAPQMAWLNALRRGLPENGILVDEFTQVGYMARAAFQVHEPRTLLSSGYQGTLGYGYAAALGAKVARPDRPVLSVNGDGGFMFNVQELATAVQHGIGVVAVVFDDGAYGNVQRMQEEMHGGRVIATDLRNPDFTAMAESFGAAGRRADTPAELETALTEAVAANEPTVIHVPVPRMPDPWPILMPRRNRPPR